MDSNNELLELIFENFPINKIGNILVDLIKSNDNIINYEIIENGEVDFNKNEFDIQIQIFDRIVDLFTKRYTHTVVINAKRIYIDLDNYLENTSITIREIKNNFYFFEFNFYSNETSFNNLKELTNILKKFAKKIADNYDIKKYYCGVEPADIESDRLFTNSKNKQI